MNFHVLKSFSYIVKDNGYIKTLKMTFKHTKRDHKGHCKYDFLRKGINKGGIIVK